MVLHEVLDQFTLARENVFGKRGGMQSKKKAFTS